MQVFGAADDHAQRLFDLKDHAKARETNDHTLCLHLILEEDILTVTVILTLTLTLTLALIIPEP